MTDTLFGPDPETCPHGRTVGQCTFCLARRADPKTSKDAAAALDLALNPKHARVLDLYRVRAMTDDEAADAAVAAGIVARHEQGRRLVRTLRESHGLLVPYERNAHLGQGEQVVRRNDSGREARVWKSRETS